MIRPATSLLLPSKGPRHHYHRATLVRRAFFATRSAATDDKNEKIPFYGLPRPPPSKNPSDSFQKRLSVAVNSAATAFRDPTRDDAVAALGEVTGTLALQRILQQMRQHPTGKIILQEKPIVTKATIPYEKYLEQARAINNDNTDPAEITFGQAYGQFLLHHEFDPDERKPVAHIAANQQDAEDLAYIILRYRQCHDYWHVLTGLPPTVLGELGLKWLELFQTGLPIAALSGTVGSIGLPYAQFDILWNQYLPWATRIHRQLQAKDPHGGSILTIYYEREFDTPLQELRDRIGMEPAPELIDS
ncbi:biosynthesis protein COQ4 [Seminavis robusta]|uniref:Ubiquinone biosynthesis protein COQ4 homolog, mitochondrial n=1 Tax=Seminavis robusta TaxID=568900 RepID=A0A9N8DRH2_9STRA|nr:biosynthesis protein COQ4 [Seminavis robusta]|eukprot:Sro299_g111530.1 biosynthesis protein COQ4 (303) ;mRNA; r:72675-73583